LAERTLSIVNDLLDAAKIEGGQFGYTFKETNINELIQKILDEAENTAKDYGIRLYFNVPIMSYSSHVFSTLSVSFINDHKSITDLQSISILKVSSTPLICLQCFIFKYI